MYDGWKTSFREDTDELLLLLTMIRYQLTIEVHHTYLSKLNERGGRRECKSTISVHETAATRIGGDSSDNRNYQRHGCLIHK